MKIVITLEHTDLIRQIEKMLAFQGMVPAGSIEFRKKRKEKGDDGDPGYEIVVECEPSGEPPDTCPTCGMSLNQTTAAPQETSGEGPAKPDKPRVYPVEEAPQEPVVLDEELGELSGPPPEIVSTPPDEEESDYVPSIASLKATNERLTREREREHAQRRGSTPKLMR